jgi:hypothetical protein
VRRLRDLLDPERSDDPVRQFPLSVFTQLFIEGNAEEVEASAVGSARQSLLDQVREEARRMNRVLGAADREKLDEYLTSVRDLEKQLARRRSGHQAEAARWT